MYATCIAVLLAWRVVRWGICREATRKRALAAAP